MAIRLFSTLAFIFLLSHCMESEKPELGLSCVDGEYAITPTLSLSYKDVHEMDFYPPKAPEERATFRVWGIVRSANSLYPQNILSPDKKWAVLKVGDAEGFVFCKTEKLLECIKTNSFDGNFRFELDNHDDEAGDPLFANFLSWEAPATFVIYVLSKSEDRSPYPEKEVYKFDLETGVFILPSQPNPVIKPKLGKN